MLNNCWYFLLQKASGHFFFSLGFTWCQTLLIVITDTTTLVFIRDTETKGPTSSFWSRFSQSRPHSKTAMFITSSKYELQQDSHKRDILASESN